MPIDTRQGTAPREGTSVASLVGDTPLVRLVDFEPRAGVEIYAKLEARNPGGSVKDRAALYIVQDAERRGTLKPGGRFAAGLLASARRRPEGFGG